jgi:hypothetical protein
MMLFFRRFVGALALEPVTFEDVEADTHSGIQAALVVLLACGASGVAAMNLSAIGWAGFAIGSALALATWIIWAMLISTIGTIAMPEPQTRSNTGELLRTLGFATAPGVFFAFAGMRTVTPFVLIVVSIWMAATTVIAVRQALDYRSTARAAAVCLAAWLLSFGLVAGLGLMFSRTVS